MELQEQQALTALPELLALVVLSPLGLTLRMYYLLVQLPPERLPQMMPLPIRSYSGTTAQVSSHTLR